MKLMDSLTTQWLQPLGQNLTTFLEELTATEPVISTRTNRSGGVIWHIYDPRNKEIIEVETEDQMLCWLDINSSRFNSK